MRYDNYALFVMRWGRRQLLRDPFYNVSKYSLAGLLRVYQFGVDFTKQRKTVLLQLYE